MYVWWFFALVFFCLYFGGVMLALVGAPLLPTAFSSLRSPELLLQAARWGRRARRPIVQLVLVLCSCCAAVTRPPMHSHAPVVLAARRHVLRAVGERALGRRAGALDGRGDPRQLHVLGGARRRRVLAAAPLGGPSGRSGGRGARHRRRREEAHQHQYAASCYTRI